MCTKKEERIAKSGTEDHKNTATATTETAAAKTATAPVATKTAAEPAATKPAAAEFTEPVAAKTAATEPTEPAATKPGDRPTLVVASGNKGKLREIAEILTDYTVVPMKDLGFTDEVEETGTTFAENAYIKASAVAKALGLPALADDSGLSVDALSGAPGVYSARYAGVHGDDAANNRKLLSALSGVEEKDRTAKFCSAVVLCYPDGSAVTGYGETYGRILFAPEGQSGFGYDPLFYSFDLKKSFGTASAQEKNAVSHRYRALVDLRAKL